MQPCLVRQLQVHHQSWSGNEKMDVQLSCRPFPKVSTVILFFRKLELLSYRPFLKVRTIILSPFSESWYLNQKFWGRTCFERPVFYSKHCDRSEYRSFHELINDAQTLILELTGQDTVVGDELSLTQVSRWMSGSFICTVTSGISQPISRRISLLVHCKCVQLMVWFHQLRLPSFPFSSTNDHDSFSSSHRRLWVQCYSWMPCWGLSLAFLAFFYKILSSDCFILLPVSTISSSGMAWSQRREDHFKPENFMEVCYERT